jgi:hypothetical protein
MKRKVPTWVALLALLVFAGSDAEAKTTVKKKTVKKTVVSAPVQNSQIGLPNKDFKPKRPEFYGYPQSRRQNPNEYVIPAGTPHGAYFSNTYGYSYGGSSQQKASPDYMANYGQYVQQYGRSNDMPTPYGFAPGTYPSNRYDARISQKERFERDRVYSAQVAMHALLLRYGTREGNGRFYTREDLTQESIRYADLLRYGMTHTYTNPETNIAP